MGGNLFKAERLSQEEYYRVFGVVSEKLKKINRKHKVPETFLEKTDHGDMDIIVCGPVIPKNEIEQIFDLAPAHVSQNTTVISILFEGRYQIDLCFHPEETFHCAIDYQKWGDTGNLVGRLAHHLGFSFGHKGLLYHVNASDTQRLGYVTISKEIFEILDFLDLDLNKWFEGFKNQEEVFEWITQSRYFTPAIFQFENLNHQNRIRNKKRPMFAAFVKWLEGREFPNAFQVGRNKAEYLWAALAYFECPKVLYEIGVILDAYKKKKRAAEIFNGEKVMAWTGLEGKELGEVIRNFREHLTGRGEKDLDAFFISSGSYKVENTFLSWSTKGEASPLEPPFDD